MSNECDHDVVFNDADDDDGMPPLVDNPLPPMTFTFTTETNHIIWNNEATTYDSGVDAIAPHMSILSPPGTPMLGPARPSHAKKRDASYIPRPPNAFILFRSSFIRAQHIPGQIEGNHSALSKIIGKYWKALPREERQVWEAKAVVALAEHRKKYPDWRFKHAANALAKVKDGPPRKRGNRKGRGQSETEERSREKRCAKIADLLVAGKTGTDLAAAIEEYDCEVDRGRKPKEESESQMVAHVQGERRVEQLKDVRAHAEDTTQVPNASLNPNAAETPNERSLGARFSSDGRFKVPLTAMFKRSSSAPAPRARAPSPNLQHIAAQRRDSICVIPSICARANSFAAVVNQRGDAPRASIDNAAAREVYRQMAGDGVSSSQTFCAGVADALDIPRSTDSGFGRNGNDTYVPRVAGNACPSPPQPAIEIDVDGLDTPALSPVTTPVMYGWSYESEIGSPTSIADMMGESYAPSPSSYSSLEGWAGSPLPYQGSLINPALSNKAHDYVGMPDSPTIMAKAFDAAHCTAFGESNEPLGLGVLGAASSPYSWPSDPTFSYGLAVGYHRQGDL
ncbi:hypothetical protein BN946_scf184844.g22 [Trametes cinnabarina]|uniref:HMG box domain-containing protein n=1 Tax=Pycnoporus cinnabarinus TaxID=5643 RepID=A0A060SF27_PYCCI|nr:hypothetical protein BN946_scf184844.g22 [Trametes cinnabarina]